jgi:sugar/nucleoside kinase (ribokinase family)
VALSAVCLDIQVFSNDDTLDAHGLKKGLTSPITSDALKSLMEKGEHTKTAGSPGANVAAGIALHGGKAALIGKVANDEDGQFLASRAAHHGITFMPVVSANDDVTTCSVAVITTPDKERSFGYVPGACYKLQPEDVDESLIREAKITYLDSYLWSRQEGRDAVRHAAEVAKKSGGLVALSLNDAGVIATHRDEYLKLAKSHADILLGDAREFEALLGTKNLDETVEALGKMNVRATITMGAQGAYAVENGGKTHIPTRPVPFICDTNGAGDQFAAGTLFGLAQGKGLVESAHIGALWASEIIQHRGGEPRPPKAAAALAC